MVLELTIQTKAGKGRKGRSFGAVVLAYATAGGLWGPSASHEVLRPVYLALATSHDEAPSVRENLRAGEPAVVRGEHMPVDGKHLELMRSGGYAFTEQRTAEGTILTAYLPELFDFQPGLIDPDAVRFVLLPAVQDLDAVPVSAEQMTSTWRHLSTLGDPAASAVSRELCAMATLWAAYLVQRCELPIPPEIDFRVQLFVAALQEGIASRRLPQRESQPQEPDQHGALGFRLHVADGFPLVPGVACLATHEDLAAFLAEQLQRYERTRPEARRRRRLGAAQARADRTEAA